MHLKVTVLLIMIALISACEQPPGETFRLDLADVTVQQQRESGGDRPYFNTISFRTTFNKAGSTEMDLRSAEPNDWVSKTQYNLGTLPGGHMQVGDSLPIPWWMGEHEWRGMKVIDLLDLLEDNQPEVAGAIVVSFDNNNTPPHVIRDILTDITNITRGIMISQIEQGGWISSLTSPDTFFTELLGIVSQELSAIDMLGYFLQLTAGSTFNPDQPTGIEIYMIPGVRGLTEPLSISEEIPELVGLGPLTVTLTILPTTDDTDISTYSGSDAIYDVTTVLDHEEYEDATETVTSLDLSVKTHGDNLRGGGRLNVNVHYCAGTSYETRSYLNLNSSEELPNYNDSTFNLSITSPVEEIKAITLMWEPGGGISTDDWDLGSLKLDYNHASGTGTYFIRHGRPLMRFTDSERSWHYRFDRSSCS